jgi:hypothetical protein
LRLQDFLLLLRYRSNTRLYMHLDPSINHIPGTLFSPLSVVDGGTSATYLPGLLYPGIILFAKLWLVPRSTRVYGADVPYPWMSSKRRSSAVSLHPIALAMSPFK